MCSVPYPHGGHDHKGKEAGPHQVPDASAIHLQGHGDDQCAQDKQDLAETQGWFVGSWEPLARIICDGTRHNRYWWPGMLGTHYQFPTILAHLPAPLGIIGRF